jgi:hypothetical protein
VSFCYVVPKSADKTAGQPWTACRGKEKLTKPNKYLDLDEGNSLFDSDNGIFIISRSRLLKTLVILSFRFRCC